MSALTLCTFRTNRNNVYYSDSCALLVNILLKSCYCIYIAEILYLSNFKLFWHSHRKWFGIRRRRSWMGFTVDTARK